MASERVMFALILAMAIVVMVSASPAADPEGPPYPKQADKCEGGVCTVQKQLNNSSCFLPMVTNSYTVDLVRLATAVKLFFGCVIIKMYIKNKGVWLE